MFSNKCSKILPAIARAGSSRASHTHGRTIDAGRVPGSYYTAKDIEFCPGRARDVMQSSVVEMSETVRNEDPFAEGKKFDWEDPMTDKGHMEVYRADNSVSLYSVMQSTVPEPFATHCKAPTHLNMPGGCSSRTYKYVADGLNSTHQSRQ